uniref:V-SNARE coiled-coil homology domain-containing protein n=1 Tax=Leptobrachium leishanense TaxID=445787 RepID=A0A8C5MHU5_9ANUR
MPMLSLHLSIVPVSAHVPPSSCQSQGPSQSCAQSVPSLCAAVQSLNLSGDPGIMSSSVGQPHSSNRKLLQTQAQVNEVVEIMRVNVDKVLDRDQKLSELDNRADALKAGASQFETSAAKLKRKYWWENCKMIIMMGMLGAFMLIILIIYFCS